MSDRKATFLIPGIWHLMRDMRREVRELVRDLDPEVQNGSVIAANELVENAVKYGAPNPTMPDVQLSIELTKPALTLTVKNGYEDHDAVNRLRQRIQELEGNKDPFELFVQRLDEVSRERHESMGLGIYRVAAEGGFRLTVEVSDAVVTIVATRALT